MHLYREQIDRVRITKILQKRLHSYSQGNEGICALFEQVKTPEGKHDVVRLFPIEKSKLVEAEELAYDIAYRNISQGADLSFSISTHEGWPHPHAS